MNKLVPSVLIFILAIIIPVSSAELGSISGYIINDTNGNGTWDPGEKGIYSWNITLMSSAGDNITTYTNSSGFYNFDGLSAGTYIVSEEVQEGWINIGELLMIITLAEGEISTNNNFTNMFEEPIQALTPARSNTPSTTNTTQSTAPPIEKSITIPALEGSIAIVVVSAAYFFVIKKREEKK